MYGIAIGVSDLASVTPKLIVVSEPLVDALPPGQWVCITMS